MGSCLGGGYQPELGCPPALALSPDVTGPDIWLSGLIELMLRELAGQEAGLQAHLCPPSQHLPETLPLSWGQST